MVEKGLYRRVKESLIGGDSSHSALLIFFFFCVEDAFLKSHGRLIELFFSLVTSVFHYLEVLNWSQKQKYFL